MAKPTWKPTQVRLGQIKAWEDNPRLSTKAQAERIIASEKKFGQPLPFLLSPEVDGKYPLLDGHQRLAAWLTVYGEEYQMDASVSNRPLTDEEHRELIITLHTGATGSWDWQSLSSWGADDLQEWGMDNKALDEWNLDATNLKELLASEEEHADAEPQIDRADELQEKWQVSAGDLWRIGEHRLICGDCTDAAVVERLMDGEKADMVFTDPPYGVGKDIKNDDLKGREFDVFNNAWISAIPRGENCGFVCYHSTRTFPSVLNAATEVGYKFERMLWYYIPDKFPAHSWKHWMMVSQSIMLFSIGDVEYSKTESDQDCYRMTSSSLGEKSGHPTEKRTENCERVMSHYSGESIYEPFAGSGTTFVACENLNRKGRGVEISEKYCAVVLQRMEDAFGITGVRI